MSPVALLSRLIPTKRGHLKCRETWPSMNYERAYNLFLDIVLLVVPLLVLGITYSLITRTLWKGIRREKALRKNCVTDKAVLEIHINGAETKAQKWSYTNVKGRWRALGQSSSRESSYSPCASCQYHTRGLRRTNAEKSLLNKKRVIKMLFAVVLEFFICWTPLYVINTIVLFDPTLVYEKIGYSGISFFQLLAYTSSCCNPLTYCFMNYSFRKSFLNIFKCADNHSQKKSLQQGSDMNIYSKCPNRRSDQAVTIVV